MALREYAYAAGRAVRFDVAIVGMAVAVAAGAVVRFAGLGSQSLWADEATTWVQATGSIRDILVATAADTYPPLHNLLVALSMRLLGDSEWALRLPSAILGTLTVPLVAWIGTMVASRRTGMLAALLMALSAFHIWYSQEARAYALLAFAAAAFLAATLWLLRSVTLPRIFALIVAGVVLLYSHPYGTFCWASVAAASFIVLWRMPGDRAQRLLLWTLAQVAIVVAFAPWAWILAHRAAEIHAHGFWIQKTTPAYVGGEMIALLSGFVPFVLLWAALIAACVTVERDAADEKLRFATRPDIAIVAAMVVGPIVLALIASVVGAPIFLSRYLIGILPAVFVLAGAGLERFANGWIGLAVVALISVVVSVVGIVWGSPLPRNDWRAAAPYIYANLPEGGCVSVSYRGAAQAIYYYGRKPLPCVIDPGTNLKKLQTNFILAARSASQTNPIERLPTPPWKRGASKNFLRVSVVSVTREAP